MSVHNQRLTARQGHHHPAARIFNKAEKLKDFKATIRRMLGYIGRKRKYVLLTFLLCLITTVINIIGTRLNGYAVDNFITSGDMQGLLRLCATLLALYLTGTVSLWLQNRLMVSTAQSTAAEIREDLYAKVQSLPLRYFDSHSSGDLMSRLTNDVDNINMTLSQSITHFFSGIINIVGMLAAMLLLSPTLTLAGLVTLPLVYFLSKIIVSFTQPLFVRQQKELGNLNGYIEERISGQKTVLLFGQEQQTLADFAAINSRLTGNAAWAQALSGFMGPVNNFVNNLSYLIVTVCGAWMLLNGMPMTVGIIFTFILYMRNFTRPVNELMNIFNSIQSALAGAERAFEVIDETPEQDDARAKRIESCTNSVAFENVSFAYHDGKEVLKNIVLHARAGQTIAVVGPTGSGKTTLINLLTKFYDVEHGKIRIDGQDISAITRGSLRQTISMVLQDTYLFSESIRENIRYGRLTADDAEVEEAARLANAHRFIRQLPDGYDTILTDNGGNLSHGQRQLLAIARAVLSAASILILDEATSSVDTRTEADIQKALLRLMQGKISFVIAHRLSTIRNADCIIAIKDGRIVEQGTHEQLISQKGFYARLYESQFKRGAE